jgi:heptosyltransferase I
MSRAPSLTDIRSVLVVKPSSLGDIVHTLPAVHLLKHAHPHLKISWVANTEWTPLLDGNPDLDEVVPFPRREFRGIRSAGKLCGWLRSIGRIKPDLALDFQGLARSALIARFAGAKAIHCLGDAEFAARIFAHRAVPAVRNAEHSVTRYLKLIADLGIDTAGPLEFPLPTGNKPAGMELPERYLLLHPYSRGENKSLSRRCLDRLVESVAPIPVIVAGRVENAGDVPPGCVNLLNRTSLTELIWLIRHAHFTMSVDSGPMHIAAAITNRLLGIHNWTNPKTVGPFNPDAWVWKNGAIFRVREINGHNPAGAENFGGGHVAQVAEFLKEKFMETPAS